MFEARFQSFDDRSERAASAPRVAALRAELKRRGLDGFDRAARRRASRTNMCRRARSGSPGSPASPARPARRWCCRPGGDLRRRPLHRCRCATRSTQAIFDDRASGRAGRRRMARGQSAGRRASSAMIPWLHTPDGAERLAKALRERAGAELIAVEPTIRSTRSGPTGPRRRSAASAARHRAIAGEDRGRQARRIRRELGKQQRRRARRAAIRNSIAWIFNIRGDDVSRTPLRARLRHRSDDGRRGDLSRCAASSTTTCAPHLRQSADVCTPPRPRARPRRRSARQERVLSTRRAPPTRSSRRWASSRRQDRARQPIRSRCTRRCKNAAEIAGARAGAIRDGAALTRFLHWFDRRRPSGKLDRDRRGRSAGSFRGETGAAQGPLVRHDRRRRARTAPSCTTASQRKTNRTHRAGRALSGRFRRPIPGRHDRRHPHRRDRHADGGDARALHAVLKGHIAIAARGVSRRHAAARSSTRWRGSPCGTPASISTMAPAMASAAISGCMRARSAFPSSAARRSSRGMIVSNEPGYYKTGAYGIRIENLVLVTRSARDRRRASSRCMGFETLTLAPIDRACRPGADDGEESHGSTPITRACAKRCRRSSMRRRRRGSPPRARPGRRDSVDQHSDKSQMACSTRRASEAAPAALSR